MKNLLTYISIREKCQMNLTSVSIVILIGLLCVTGLLFICAMPIQQGWNDSDLIFCCIIPIITVLGMTMCFLTKSCLKFGLTDVMVLILYGYFTIRYYTDATYPADSIEIHASLSIFFYFAMRLVFAGGQFNGNVLTISLLAFAGYEAIYGIVQLIYGTSRHELYPVTGSFNNPGPYSACIAIGLVIVFTYIRYPRFLEFLNNHQRFRLIVSTVNQMLAVIFAALIIITLSRTAIVAIALCLSILFWDRMGRWKWLALVGCLALGISLYIVKSGSADGRMTIYFVGAYAIIDNPLLGNGVGSFFHRIAETTQMLSLSETNMDLKPIDVIEYAFNDWLRITVELGFICLVLVSVIVVYTLGDFYKLNIWKSEK